MTGEIQQRGHFLSFTDTDVHSVLSDLKMYLHEIADMKRKGERGWNWASLMRGYTEGSVTSLFFFFTDSENIFIS